MSYELLQGFNQLTFQAYYGPRVAVPAYFNSAVAPGHTPHPYMWGPQVFTRQKCFCFSC